MPDMGKSVENSSQDALLVFIVTGQNVITNSSENVVQ